MMTNFEIELRALFDKCFKENNSTTPDFILAEYLNFCLVSYNRAVKMKSEWHDAEHKNND